MLEITSRDNARLKFARAVRDDRADGREQIFIEGLRLAEEAIAANLEITDYFFTAEFAAAPRGKILLENLAKQSKSGAMLSSNLLASIAETKSPPGVVVLARAPETGKSLVAQALERSAQPLLIVLHEINNPLNVGAILRTAEAAGVAAAILTKTTADPFAPKALRGAMGSAFRLPLWESADFFEVIEFCRNYKIKTLGSDVRAEKTLFKIDWTTSHAIFIGSEAHGFNESEINKLDESLKIPMQAPVESLNAAVACGIILYEARRQRSLSK